MQLDTKIEPGDIGYLIHLHGTLYSPEYKLDLTFEAYVAIGLGEFVKSLDSKRDCLWLAKELGKIVGSIAIVGAGERDAQLRWFLVHPDVRGQGLGKKLIAEALRFCRDRGYQSVFLWTISELNVAAHLYRQAGLL